MNSCNGESRVDSLFTRFPRGFVFLERKHFKLYRAIIGRALDEERTKDSTTYYESHHIVPKSYDRDNSKENIVLLTAREHYICHLLLCKMFANIIFRRKMTRALAFFQTKIRDELFTARTFELARKSQSRGMKGNKLSLGYKQSDIHVRKRVESWKKTMETKKSLASMEISA